MTTERTGVAAGPATQRDDRYKQEIIRLEGTPFYVRIDTGPDLESALLCLDNGEADTTDIAKFWSLTYARGFIEFFAKQSTPSVQGAEPDEAVNALLMEAEAALECGQVLDAVDPRTILAMSPYNALPPSDIEGFREQAAKFDAIIRQVEARCMAVDGPVTPTLKEITEDELRKLWLVCERLRSLPLPGKGTGWRDEATAPLGEFVLARPRGTHPATGKLYIPMVLQRQPWGPDGRLYWYAPDNEIEPVHLVFPGPGEPPWPEFGVEWHRLPASPSAREG